MKIAIGSDHAGFDFKEEIVNHLEEQGHRVEDYGTHSIDSVDYPDFAHPVSKKVDAKEVDFGVLVCGSGNGVAMTANKHPNVRAAISWSNQISRLAREHNNANIIAIPARFVTIELAREMVDTFLNTEFEGGRHARRVGKISSC